MTIAQDQLPQVDKSVRDAEADLEQLADLILDLYRWERSMVRRLESDPEGFVFAAEGHTCGICVRSISGDMWYDTHGMRCVDCNDAYRAKIIPAYVVKGSRDKGYITKAYLSVESGLQDRQIKRLVAKGELSARIIKHNLEPDTYLFLRTENPSIVQYFS